MEFGQIFFAADEDAVSGKGDGEADGGGCGNLWFDSRQQFINFIMQASQRGLERIGIFFCSNPVFLKSC